MNKEQFVITDGLLNNDKFICKMKNDKITIQRETIKGDIFYGVKPRFKVHVVAPDNIYSYTYLVQEITYDINTKEIILLKFKNINCLVPSTERMRISDDDIFSVYSFSVYSDEILIVINKIE